MRKLRTLGLATLVLAATACGDNAVAPVLATCAHQLGTVCVGVPQSPVCDGDVCTSGVGCGSVVSVKNDAELGTAAAAATSGSCIALAPGSYSAVTLPGGVSLLGKGAASVTIAGVTLGAGSGAVVRGMRVTSGGIHLDGATDARIDSVEVFGSMEDGVQASGGSSFSAVMIDVDGSGRNGIGTFDTAQVSIERSVIRGGSGPGIWAQCSAGCDCAQKPGVTISDTVVTDNKIVGISLIAVDATIEHVDVTDNTEADDFRPGGGVVASECTSLSATGMRILDNTSFGLLIDHSTANVGGTAPGEAVSVNRNGPGVWVQHLAADGTQPVKLDGCEVDANAGVGLGLSGESKGIMFWNSAVTGTLSVVVPVLTNGSAGKAMVGDGISWQELSQADIKNVTLSGNTRQSILIDGAVGAGSSLADITLSAGDEASGILEQNLDGGDTTPTVGPNVPAIMTTMAEQFSVPRSPAVPSL